MIGIICGYILAAVHFGLVNVRAWRRERSVLMWMMWHRQAAVAPQVVANFTAPISGFHRLMCGELTRVELWGRKVLVVELVVELAVRTEITAGAAAVAAVRRM